MTASIDQVRRTVLDTQRPGGAGVPPGMVSRAVRTSPGVRTDAAQLALERAARSEMLGAGPVLQPLLEDPAVTDVLVNGDGSVWVDRGAGLDVRRERLPDPRRLATRLAAAAGQRLDDGARSEEHTSELQSRFDLVCRLLLEKKKIHTSGQ